MKLRKIEAITLVIIFNISLLIIKFEKICLFLLKNFLFGKKLKIIIINR